jgi:DHA1 family bicyclomycin/chloramphenicol resistance-like MFS transporter
MKENKIPIGFVILMAFLMSLAALAIDAMMPALGAMRESLGVVEENDIQLVISIVFLGMSFGLILYGPLSDAYGRKKALYLGISVFIVGSFLSILTNDFTIVLVGRFLQGFGAAACRVVSTALIRDQYKGPEMGKIMSLIMVIFIIVPALAPSVGQLILFFAPWQGIFVLFIVLGILAIGLLHFKQEETLPLEKRIPISFKTISSGVLETLRHTKTRGYMIASGLIFGAFVGYLSSAQQILQIQFNLGKSFTIAFGCLALFIGISSFINSKLVMRFGMERLSLISLAGIAVISGCYLLLIKFVLPTVGLYGFLTYLGVSFLFVGILFGNLNTLAIEPLGHIAGTANSVITSIQTFLSVGIGGFIGHQYDGSIVPLVLSYFVLSILSIITIMLSRREKP